MKPELKKIIEQHYEWSPEGDMRMPFFALALVGEAGRARECGQEDFAGAYAFMLAHHAGVDLEQIILEKVKEVETRPAWIKFAKSKGWLK